MLPSFANATVLRVRPTWRTDARGNRVPDYGPDVPRVPVPGCHVEPGASMEVMGGVGDRFGGRDSVSIRWSVYAPPGADLVSTDAVELEDGRLYQINGEPMRYPSPTGALSHVLLLLIDWR